MENFILNIGILQSPLNVSKSATNLFIFHFLLLVKFVRALYCFILEERKGISFYLSLLL